MRKEHCGKFWRQNTLPSQARVIPSESHINAIIIYKFWESLSLDIGASQLKNRVCGREKFDFTFLLVFPYVICHKHPV